MYSTEIACCGCKVLRCDLTWVMILDITVPACCGCKVLWCDLTWVMILDITVPLLSSHQTLPYVLPLKDWAVLMNMHFFKSWHRIIRMATSAVTSVGWNLHLSTKPNLCGQVKRCRWNLHILNPVKESFQQLVSLHEHALNPVNIFNSPQK